MNKEIINSLKYPLLVITLFVLMVARAQSYQLGVIDFYGNFSNVSQLRKCLPFKENDTILFLNDTAYLKVWNQVNSCLLSLEGNKQSDINFVCCNDVDGKLMAFVGVDTIARTYSVRKKTKDIVLTSGIKNDYDSMMNLLLIAIETGHAGEIDTMGHSLSEYPPIRAIEEKFIIYANQHLKLLRKVLKYSKYEEDRYVAAWVIAYYKDKAAITGDLLGAVTDNDNTVRNNAVRAIGIIADYSRRHPELGIVIPADPFIAMINSISWTDRNKSGSVLLSLTASRNKALLDQLKREALKPIVDMAGWKSTGHASAGFILLGRIAGWTDEKIYAGIGKDREVAIKNMLADIGKL